MLDRVLCVIPARGGSKGVVRKNLRLVGGESLIARAIRTAAESNRVTEYLVTTDDDEIAEVAEALGCPVRRRGADLSSDAAPVTLAVGDALKATESQRGFEFDAVVLLQPTAPLRRGSDVDAMVRLLENDEQADCVISVCSVEDVHPARMYEVDAEGRMHPLWPDWERARRQDLPVLFYRNGAVYLTRRSAFVEIGELMGRSPLAYVMPSEWLANVDDERDLLIADVLAARWDADTAGG